MQEADIAAARAIMATQGLHALVPCGRAQHAAQRLHRRVLQQVGMADQQVVLLTQWNKIQAFGDGSRGNAKPYIGLPLRNCLGDGVMAGFFIVKTHDVFGVQVGLRHQVSQYNAGACPQRAVDKLCLALGNVLQALKLQWVACGHNQPLRAAPQADAAVLYHVKQRLIDMGRHRVFARCFQHVEASQCCPAFIQCAQGIDTDARRQVQVHR